MTIGWFFPGLCDVRRSLLVGHPVVVSPVYVQMNSLVGCCRQSLPEQHHLHLMYSMLSYHQPGIVERADRYLQQACCMFH